jgi:hypothetical protein
VSTAGAIAVAFVRLGAVLATLEAPPRFRAPGITLPLGLGIGRLVFRAHQVGTSPELLKVIGLVTGGVALLMIA